MRRTITLAVAAAMLAAPAAAQAHVTLQPEQAPAGAFTRLDVRVPNEREDASTTKVEVKFPPGFEFVSTEPVPGWTAKVKTVKLPKPVTNDEGEQVTDRVDTVTWTGDGKQGTIGPAQFQDFGLSLATPDKPGASLTFKALQTYDNGEVVRWIGAPGADEPAPQVELATAVDEGHGSAQADTRDAASVQPESGGDDGNRAPTWLAVLALVLGALGLAAGVAGLRANRKGVAAG